MLIKKLFILFIFNRIIKSYSKVEIIKSDCAIHCNQCDYLGSLNTTLSGTPCRPWSDYPQFEEAQFPDGTKEKAMNFCRNPKYSNMESAWCYTSDGVEEYEYCDTCAGGYQISYKACSLTNNGSDYAGYVAVTMSGQQCLPWSRFASSSDRNESFRFPEKNATAASNYCRNPTPSKRSGPWCHSIAAAQGWEYCDVCRPFRGTWTKTEYHRWDEASTAKLYVSGLTDCLTYCIQVGACKGISYNKNDKTCRWKTEYSGNMEESVHYDYYELNRVCTQGLDYYPNPMLGEKFPFGHMIAMPNTGCWKGTYEGKETKTSCLDLCFQIANCKFIQYSNENGDCYYFALPCEKYETNSYLFTLVRCDNELIPLEDELPPNLALERQAAEKAAADAEAAAEAAVEAAVKAATEAASKQADRKKVKIMKKYEYTLEYGIVAEEYKESQITAKTASLVLVGLGLFFLIVVVCTTIRSVAETSSVVRGTKEKNTDRSKTP